jgi:hypothetical protein
MPDSLLLWNRGPSGFRRITARIRNFDMSGGMSLGIWIRRAASGLGLN